MSHSFSVSPGTLREIAQSLLELKKMARSIESSAESFMPLTDEQMTSESLREIVALSGSLSKHINAIYVDIARPAMRDV